MKKEAVIRHEDGKYVLYDSEGEKVLGRHDTKEEAKEQERAIQASKHGSYYKIGADIAFRDIFGN